MSIKHITTKDVHDITSGQVITDLTNIVKELLENSIDANSTQISIIFKNNGLESIEVIDNGDGIKQDDFLNICLKNHTSKLEDFKDLSTVKTLGFRGEAMNSICNVSNVVISTSTANEQPRGWILSFDNFGELVEKKLISQNKGTGVRVNQIFHNLPVRKINLVKNIKKEFQKCLAFLQQYILICTNIRIIVYNIDLKNRKNIVLKSNGSILKDNIINLFGTNGMNGLEEIQFKLDNNVEVNGYISNYSFGQGRSSKDRQFWFINNRPVKLNNFNKTINEIYKNYNHLQFPVIILNLKISTQLIDVNVTPDKNVILIANEKKLLENLGDCLKDFYNLKDFKIPVVNNGRVSERNGLKQLKIDSYSNVKEDVEVVEKLSVRKSKITTNQIQDVESEEEGEKQERNEQDGDGEQEKDDDEEGELISSQLSENVVIKSIKEPERKLVPQINMNSKLEAESGARNEEELEEDYDAGLEEDHKSLLEEDHEADLEAEHKTKFDPGSDSESKPQTEIELQVSISELPSTQIEEDSQLTLKRPFNDSIRIDIPRSELKLKRIKLSEPEGKIKIEANDISNKELNEHLLTLNISKEDFLKMKIIGQFNLGFILVTSKNKDIFIIDQHASDEKYNFEKLQRETVFKNQPLVIPQPLELNTIDELIIKNNLSAFEKNGFKFKISNDDSKLQLISLPYSKDTLFDITDLHELIHLIQNNPESRPSKVRQMFAMRACRSSVMVGKPLNRRHMRHIVDNLSTLNKPWNCPHGRPTMRHILHTENWLCFSDDYH